MRAADAFFYALISILSVALVFLHSPTSMVEFKDEASTHEKVMSSIYDGRGAKETPYYFSSNIKSNTRMLHSPSIVKVNYDSYLIAYYGGSREGSKDVKVYANVFHPREYSYSVNGKLYKGGNHGQMFSDTSVLLDRGTLSKYSKQYIKKLGNPLLYADESNVYLFVVATSFGGWAASRIYALKADVDEVRRHVIINGSDGVGSLFKYQGHFILSQFFNISHLVRSAAIPLPYGDGSFVLPIYFEMGVKKPVFAMLNPELDIISTTRPVHDEDLLQPSIVGLENDKCLAVYRSASVSDDSRLVIQRCGSSNGLLGFEAPYLSNLENNDSSVALFSINDNVYIVYNSRLGSHTRGSLNLGMWDGYDFVKIKEIDRYEDGNVDYPNVVVNGNYAYIVYRKGNSSVEVVGLNSEYLEGFSKQKDLR